MAPFVISILGKKNHIFNENFIKIVLSLKKMGIENKLYGLIKKIQNWKFLKRKKARKQ